MQPSNTQRFFIHAAAGFASLLFIFVSFTTFTLSAHAGPSTGGTAGGPSTPGNVVGGPSQSNQTQTQATGQTIANPLKYNSLNDLLTAVLKAAIQIGTIILTLALVLVGFKFVAARGNEEKIRGAKTALMWTVIGGLILLGATAIQSVIQSTVGSLTP